MTTFHEVEIGRKGVLLVPGLVAAAKMAAAPPVSDEIAVAPPVSDEIAVVPPSEVAKAPRASSALVETKPHIIRESLKTITQAPVRPKIVIALVPACDEEKTIVGTVNSLLDQERVLDGIVIVVNNCTDKTEAVARSAFAHDHRVIILVMDHNPDRKVGALSYGFQAIIKSCWEHETELDYLVGMDGDTIITPTTVGSLLAEMESNSKLGALSARYTFDPKLGRTRIERLMIRMQRLEFASAGLETIYRDRDTYVIGGQASIFRGKAMLEVAERFKLGNGNGNTPWDAEDEVEDMGLTWKMKELGWQTKVSAIARAYAGPMFTIRTLWKQRRKWDGGTLKLLFDTNPWTSKQVWGLQARNLLDFTVRIMFAVLLTASLILHIYRWSWWWLIPPAIAVLLNYKVARRVPNRTVLDTFLAVILMPVEIYLMFRLLIWGVSLFKTVIGSRKDLWAEQLHSERTVAERQVASQ